MFLSCFKGETNNTSVIPDSHLKCKPLSMVYQVLCNGNTAHVHASSAVTTSTLIYSLSTFQLHWREMSLSLGWVLFFGVLMASCAPSNMALITALYLPAYHLSPSENQVLGAWDSGSSLLYPQLLLWNLKYNSLQVNIYWMNKWERERRQNKMKQQGKKKGSKTHLMHAQHSVNDHWLQRGGSREKERGGGEEEINMVSSTFALSGLGCVPHLFCPRHSRPSAEIILWTLHAPINRCGGHREPPVRLWSHHSHRDYEVGSQSLAPTSGICYPRVNMNWFIGPAHHYSSFFLPGPCPEWSPLYLERSQ